MKTTYNFDPLKSHPNLKKLLKESKENNKIIKKTKLNIKNGYTKLINERLLGRLVMNNDITNRKLKKEFRKIYKYHHGR
jgi:hypothetical protein